jgi:DNA-directed RNA polymerase subunit RPC12/RpoP
MEDIILNINDYIVINVTNFINLFAAGAFISCWVIPWLCILFDYLSSTNKCVNCGSRNFIPDGNILICYKCGKEYVKDFRGKIQV